MLSYLYLVTSKGISIYTDDNENLYKSDNGDLMISRLKNGVFIRMNKTNTTSTNTTHT